MEKINLSDWTQFSTRSYSKSYVSKDGKWMIKADHSENSGSPDFLLHEQKFSKRAYELGVPTPKAGGVVLLDDGFYGAIYEYIPEKISFARAVSEHPERLEEYIERFAFVTKKMHQTKSDTSVFPSIESVISEGLIATPIFTEAEKDIIRGKLEEIPKDTMCLHGDMTPSNAILSPSGDYVIDLGTMAYGHPYYDVGQFLHMSRYCSDELSMQLFHFGSDILKKSWQLFAKYYFGTEDVKAVEELVNPYSKLGCLAVLKIFSTPDTVRNGKDFILS